MQPIIALTSDTATHLRRAKLYQGLQSLLTEQSQVMALSQEMAYWVRGVPSVANLAGITFAARETKEGTLYIPKGSYLLSVCFYCSEQAGPTEPSFQFYLRDESGNSLFDTGYGLGPLSASGMQEDPTTVGTESVFGPYYLMAPYSVLPSQTVQWGVTNLATAAAYIQVVTGWAVPKEIIR